MTQNRGVNRKGQRGGGECGRGMARLGLAGKRGRAVQRGQGKTIFRKVAG